ncbi:delta-1-pyrroline-5-carboxylate dehydrogenase 1 [Cystobasidium minutum MCA 4210]|uniref:delta-1-pyrroline-5-carboxylate dehydrogenase 1 n=1 Tax=Cystobasidium minutum MCA 4210 TaxID=1397322 RepID=UPI0034CE729D|eukprot:jgi/Rhomi1/57430/CE57429_2708
MAQLATFKIPAIDNEPNKHYEPGTPARKALRDALKQYSTQEVLEIPCVVNGKEVKTGNLATQINPSDRSTLCRYHQATPDLVKEAIEGALKAKLEWEALPWADRASVFLKAADLISGKYRAKICASVMLGQGKNVWQAEIDAAAELCDFLRFGVQYAEEVYATQPPKNAPGVWNRVEYRPLEGFVFAVTPFNFAAIAGNLSAAPAMLGNVCLWKPSPMAVHSGYLIQQIFQEAGLPDGVIQFLPVENPVEMCKIVFEHRDFASLHFTGSTKVFKQLWADIGNNINKYKSYPRIVGETGGKNFHLVHKSADVRMAVIESIRAAFEYQGQKCSALSRLYVPKSLWTAKGGFKEMLVAECDKITVGPVTQFQHFMTPVISQASYDKATGYIKKALDAGGKLISGGLDKCSDEKGFFVWPTVIETSDPHSVTMVEEIFGPVLTVYVYEDEDYEKAIDLCDSTTEYALTGAIFAQDRKVLSYTARRLEKAAGNFYINTKCTGAVVGQQPFGGSRSSGTNDKAGSVNLLFRFLNTRAIKESFVYPDNFAYPSNVAESGEGI